MLWRIIIPALLGSANATAGSAQFYLATFFTTAIWLGSWLLSGSRLSFSNHGPRELARARSLAQRSLCFHPRQAHRSLYPLVGEAGERSAGQYAPRKCPFYPDHTLYQRRGRRAILPRCCPPPACRRPPPPRHSYPTSPLHRRYRRNGHPLLLVASILNGGITALEAPCRRLHLRHHAAPSMKHRNGVLMPVVMRTCGLQQIDKIPRLSENEIISPVHAVV